MSPSDDIQTFQECSRFIFNLVKFFGYSLFKFPDGNLKKYKIVPKVQTKTTFIDVVVLLTVTLVYIFLFYYNAVLQFRTDMTDSIILEFIGQLCLIVGLTVSFGSILLCYVRRERILTIFTNICYIDIGLETLYENLVVVPLSKRKMCKLNRGDVVVPRILDYKKHFQFTILVVVTGLTIICLNLALSFSLLGIKSNTGVIVYASYGVQNASFFIITTQMVLFLLVIKTRFAALNKLICYYLKLEDETINAEVEEIYSLENYLNDPATYPITSKFFRNEFNFERKIIAEFGRIHDKLNDVVEWINSCYAAQCLGVVAVSFGYGILTFFSLYDAICRNTENTKLAIVYMAWFIFYSICVTSLIVVSCAVYSDGRKTGILLHKSINQITVDSYLRDTKIAVIIDSLRTFSHQLQKRSPIVSCGLFKFDWTLLFSIISASTTYLIILIQFDRLAG